VDNVLELPGQGLDMRQKDDWYPTPPEATQALLDVEQFTNQNAALWEPACGDGAICKVLEANGYEFWATDLNDYGYGDKTGIDFLMETKPWGSAIISNPPYKLAEQFITHAIHLGCTKHAWLLRLSFLEGIQRYWRLFAMNPPAKIYVFSRRLTIWRGDQEVSGSGTTAYAWFVWQADHHDDPAVRWIA
jgi:hypothetical protein